MEDQDGKIFSLIRERFLKVASARLQIPQRLGKETRPGTAWSVIQVPLDILAIFLKLTPKSELGGAHL